MAMASTSNLFESLTRIFSRSGSEDSQQTIGKGKQRAPPSPSYYSGGLSRTPSSLALSLERTRPSHVSWLAPTPGSPSPNPSVSLLKSPNHSASSNDEVTPEGPRQLTPAPGLRKSAGSESLRIHPVFLTDASGSTTSLTPGKQSTSDERPIFPTMRHPSMDSIPLTPDSVTSHSTHTAFINRPLKRTISGGSTSTLRTVASLNTPSIPLVDVRPNFAASLGVAPGRRSNLATPTLPTVVGSPRQNITVSIIYEDSVRTNSFITAPSIHVSDADSDIDLERGPDEDEYDLGEPSSPFDDQHEVYMETRYEPYGEARHEDTSHSHMSLPSGLYDIELSPMQRSSTPATSESLDEQHSLDEHHSLSERHSIEDERSVLETISRRSQTSDATAVETAIQRRWLQGLSFGSFRSEQRTWKGEGERNGRVTSACILFWLGFVAPWCWLIGGWYLSTSGEVKADGQYLQTVEWKWPRRGRAKSIVKPSKEAKSKRTLSSFWRSHVRAQETMPMSPVDNRSVHTVRSMVEEKNGYVHFVDPWVKRCRFAAAFGGSLLCVAVIVCIIVLAVRR